MKAMIFAAGLGTRLKPLTDDRPKALVVVNGKTLLEHSILYLRKYGITDIVINVHHFADLIVDILKVNNGFGATYQISDERDEVLETGGGLKKASSFFAGAGEILLLNVDIMTNLNLDKFLEAHHGSDALVTLAVMKRQSSRYLLFDNEGWLSGWENMQTGEQKIARRAEPVSQLAFSGISLIKEDVLADIPFTGKFSLINLYLYLAKELVIQAFDHSGDVLIDVGKPESLSKAASLFI